MEIEKSLKENKLTYCITTTVTQRAAVITILCAVLLFFIYTMHYRINCQNKTAGQASQCQLITSFYSLLHFKTTLPELKGARVIRSSWSFLSTSNSLYNIDLMTDGGPINMAYFPEPSLNEMKQVSNRINDYIANSNSKTFDIHSITTFWGYLSPLFILALGIITLIIGFRISITFDKGQNQFILKQNLLLYFKTFTYSLDKLTGVQLIILPGAKNQNRYKLKFKISGKRSLETMTFNNVTESACEELIININTFMGYDPEPVEHKILPTDTGEKKQSRYTPRLIFGILFIIILTILQFFHINI